MSKQLNLVMCMRYIVPEGKVKGVGGVTVLAKLAAACRLSSWCMRAEFVVYAATNSRVRPSSASFLPCLHSSFVYFFSSSVDVTRNTQSKTTVLPFCIHSLMFSLAPIRLLYLVVMRSQLVKN